MQSEYQAIYHRFVTVYLPSLQLTPRTRQEYAWDVEAFLAHLRTKSAPHLTSLNIHHLQHYLAATPQTTNPNTERRKAASLRTFCDLLVKLGQQPRNIADELVLPRRNPTTPDCFSVDEIQSLEASAAQNSEAQAIVSLLLHTGLTLSELTSLKVSDLPLSETGSFKSNFLRIAPPGRHYKARILPLTPAVIDAIEGYLDSRPLPPDAHLFPNPSGARISARGMRDKIIAILRSAGIEGKSPQTFRNTFAARLFARGVDVEIVQRMMGHESKKTTQRYEEAGLHFLQSALACP